MVDMGLGNMMTVIYALRLVLGWNRVGEEIRDHKSRRGKRRTENRGE